MKTEELIGEFMRNNEREYDLREKCKGIRDKRKEAKIGAYVIFLSIMLIVVLRKGSILQIDQLMRSKRVRKMFGVKGKEMVVSDSTIERSLSGFEIEPLRGYLEYVNEKVNRGKIVTEVCGEEMIVGSIDGSQFGKFWGSVFMVAGEVDLMMGIERYEKRGKELAASRRLMSYLFGRFGRGFVDVVLMDGLYKDKRSINLCLSNGSIPLIKTDEERLLVIEQAKNLFSNYENFKEIVQYEEGFDDERLCSYKVYCCGGFEYEGVDTPCQVAYVQEEYPKEKDPKKRFRSYYVISFGSSFTPLQMRELGHLRWRIENNGFRQLNAQTNCDHVYTHNENAFLALMLIFFIGWNLWQLFLLTIDENDLRKEWGKVKLTFNFFSFLALISLFTFPVDLFDDS